VDRREEHPGPGAEFGGEVAGRIEADRPPGGIEGQAGVDGHTRRPLRLDVEPVADLAGPCGLPGIEAGLEGHLLEAVEVLGGHPHAVGEDRLPDIGGAHGPGSW
jgi:hypothetical protein